MNKIILFFIVATASLFQTQLYSCLCFSRDKKQNPESHPRARSTSPKSPTLGQALAKQYLASKDLSKKNTPSPFN